MEFAGLIGSVILLIWLALRGIDIVFAALICATVVIVTNDLPFAAGFTEYFASGPLGAFSFAGRFYLLFIAGAVFGRIMGESHAASSLAMALIQRLGAHRALLICTIACALLTYGGVVVFVVIFAIYPLGLRLLQESNIPKRLLLGAIALGSGTFTLTALPGTPSIHNVISASALGTDLFAAPLLGIIGGLLMFAFGMVYLERERVKAEAAGEGFIPGPRDEIVAAGDPTALPPWPLALFPLALVIGTILMPRLLKGADLGSGVASRVLEFASTQPVLWPSMALFVGSLVALAMFPAVRRHGLTVAGRGTQDAIMPLINTAAVIGFGGVVTQTSGFANFTAVVLNSDLPPLISAFFSVSLVSAITGSASGGLQIFMQSMAPAYIEMGIAPEVLHRVTAMASGGVDSLPHCGAVVAMLTITQLTHRQAYKDVGIITVVFPVLATLIVIGLVALGL
ncbi:GntP family permease [Congregibacter sp.]|uniref:GntP family permease n=1 Tax=Congregibacter sp. TaxID=2744308 RepID=UPI003F6B2416